MAAPIRNSIEGAFGGIPRREVAEDSPVGGLARRCVGTAGHQRVGLILTFIASWWLVGQLVAGGDLGFGKKYFLVTLPQTFCMGKILWICM